MTDAERDAELKSWRDQNRGGSTCPIWADGVHCFEMIRGIASPGPRVFKVCACGARVLPAPELLIDPESPWRHRL